ncbi:MAG: hypothetical protein M9894_11135 [Planctomycetes bacterium]|nr:hypothetical protein [Planctomycetota bacterium]
MGLDIVARAEPGLPWEELSRRCRRALPAGGWRELALGGPAAEEGPRLAEVDVGPAAPVAVQLHEGALVAHARTTPWGPGYHQRVAAILDRLGSALPGGWREVRDATGYFQARRRLELCRRFLDWGHAACDAAVQEADRVGLTTEGPLEVPPGQVATPTGFKARAWARDTRAALDRARRSVRPDRLGRAARDAFLWWCAAPDAVDLSQLGRALCASDVIWRPLEGEDDPDQEVVRRRALDCFEAALRADPRAPVPLPEMRRLYELAGRAEHGRPGEPGQRGRAERDRSRPGAGRPGVAVPEDGPALRPGRTRGRRTAERLAGEAQPGTFWGGYREGWIRLAIGAWAVGVPGWLRGAVRGEGHDVFWDDEMTVHVSVGRGPPRAFSPRAAAARHVGWLPPAERALARVEVIEAGGDVRGYAVVVPTPDAGTRDALIQGLVAHRADRVGFTVVARTPAACDMALQFGRSLRPA